MITRAFSPRVNLAVVADLRPDETDAPMPSASDDENTSMSNMSGLWASSPCLTGSLHITPDDVIITRLDRSQRPGLASSVRTIGLANASPTMMSELTRRASMVSSSSSMSKWRPSSSTTTPAPLRAMKVVNWPVPCMSGGPGSSTPPGAAPVSFSRMAS